MTTSLDQPLFGVAYYDEYMPRERLETDIEMMHRAGINVVRIGESTWGTLEPQPDIFDFTHIDRVLDAMEPAGISVIVGTPTYAIPTWLAADHPEVLAETATGRGRYGARQNMNILSPAYRFHAERVIRRLIEHTASRPGVIGFQIDNETKYYDTAGADVQRAFVRHLRQEFAEDLSALNRAFGLNYWSNRINAWEDFPNVLGTINGSLAAAFDEFRRGLVDEFLAWQAGIVREYAREDQFITHNFDFDWTPGWSYGLQPAVNHFHAARSVDLAGVDIYHPSEDGLTGREIAFGGDMARSIKGGANYVVLETQAQGQMGWLPYPGQLRLQALSHFASGADGIMYWHWHSIHNSFETYWKGLLSHDLESNPTYEEACTIGADLQRYSDSLLHLRKKNRVAVMVSNEALTALTWFGVETGFPLSGPSMGYNDVLRWIYDVLFDLNLECDFVPPEARTEELSRYPMLVVPALYSSPESTLTALRSYVEDGGHLVTTFRSAVTSEHVTVWDDRAPHLLTDVLGLTYNQFTRPKDVRLTVHGELAEAEFSSADLQAEHFMELLQPASDTEVLASYDHHAWHDAAITRHRFGTGEAVHVGTGTSPALLARLLQITAARAGVCDWAQDLAGTVTVRRGHNAHGHSVTYFLNYSEQPVTFSVPLTGRDVLGGRGEVSGGSDVTIEGWGALVLES
jgi:beta-galactosidase